MITFCFAASIQLPHQLDAPSLKQNSPIRKTAHKLQSIYTPGPCFTGIRCNFSKEGKQRYILPLLYFNAERPGSGGGEKCPISPSSGSQWSCLICTLVPTFGDGWGPVNKIRGLVRPEHKYWSPTIVLQFHRDSCILHDIII